MLRRLRHIFLTLFLFGSFALNGISASETNPDLAACRNALIGINFGSAIDELLTHLWVDQKFSAVFLKQLRPISDEALANQFKIEPAKFHAMASEFHHQRTGFSRISSNYFIAERETNQGPQAVVVFLMKLNGETVGFLALSFQQRAGELEACSEYLKVNPKIPDTNGMSKTFYSFTRNFYEKTGVYAEKLVAGWAGRPIWALMDYDLDPETKFSENGVQVSQLDFLRHNFQRFLQFHKVRVEDLYIERDLGGREPVETDLGNLITPRDFVMVKSKSGVLIEYHPYVDADVLGELTRGSPGKAFSLWDYRPRQGQTVLVDQDGKALSDIAMPTWIGIYRFK